MPGTVLVVEDEPDIVDLLRDFLDVAGFAVVVAGDAEEALSVLDEHPIDCALVDVMLPGASGFDLCRRVRATSDLPLLFLTARGDDSDKLRGLGSGRMTTSSSRPRPPRSWRACRRCSGERPSRTARRRRSCGWVACVSTSPPTRSRSTAGRSR